MEMIALDTLGKLYQHGHELFGWCSECGSPSRYWDNVKARRAPPRAIFDIDVTALIRDHGEDSPVVGMTPMRCPRCGSRNTETRIAAPAKRRD
jgi:predicted nucleic-acid-binding Zn-ribbon protein